MIKLLSKSIIDSLTIKRVLFSRKLVCNEQLDTLNLSMCTGLTVDCCHLLITKLSLYV